MDQDSRVSRKTRRALMEEILLESRSTQSAADSVDEAVMELLGVNRTDVICLDILDRLGTVTAGRLAAESRLTTGAVTAVVDRLEAAGYVRRVRDASDRRRVLIETTELARRIGRGAYGPIADGARAFERRFSREELEGILRFLRLGRELNLRQAEQIREQARQRRANTGQR